QRTFLQAHALLEEALVWAESHDTKEYHCWSAKVSIRLALAEGRTNGSQAPDEKRTLLEKARRRVDEGLRLARAYGYSLHHAELPVLRGVVPLLGGHVEDAERDALAALEGIPPPEQSRQPRLLGAAEPECSYAWGEAEARQLLAEALLLRAARVLGQASFDT